MKCTKSRPLEFILFFKDDDEILFEDRISLGVHFLSSRPNELKDFFSRMLKKCIDTVNIKGIMLTGLSTNCIQLFSAFNEKTNDVQTIALAIIHSTFYEVLNDPIVRSLIEW
jgi:hypothetical protein